MIVLWTAAAFLSGSFMFSYWLGLTARHDLKSIGDGNPGAANLWRAAGMWYGLLGVLLDFMKGWLPVGWLAGSGHIDGYAIVPIAVAPIAGHAFSPWLRGKGGKAIAVTFGVWSGLTRFEASLAYAIILAVLLAAGKYANRHHSGMTKEADAFQVLLGMVMLGCYLLARGFSAAVLSVWICNVLLLGVTHRRELGNIISGGGKSTGL